MFNGSLLNTCHLAFQDFMNWNKGEDHVASSFKSKQHKTLKTKFLSFHRLEQGGWPFHYLRLSQLEQHKIFDQGLRFRLSSFHKLQQGGPFHYLKFSQIGTTHTHRTWLGFHESQERGGCFSLPWAISHIGTTKFTKLDQALTIRNLFKFLTNLNNIDLTPKMTFMLVIIQT
jgi:hypothetical protein